MKCHYCSGDVEEERVEFGLEVCLKCANKGRGQERVLGVMTYAQKAGGELQLMTSRRQFNTFKAMQRQQGRGGGFNSSTGSVAARYAEAVASGTEDDRFPDGVGAIGDRSKMEARMAKRDQQLVSDQIPEQSMRRGCSV